MMTSMATHTFAPIAAQAGQALQPNRPPPPEPNEKPPAIAAVGGAAPSSSGATSQAVAQIRLQSRAEQEALLDMREQTARAEARKGEGERILDESAAGPVAMARGGGVGGDASLVRSSGDLAPGPQRSGAAEAATRLLSAAREEADQYEARLAATRGYEAARAAVEAQAQQSAEKALYTGVYI